MSGRVEIKFDGIVGPTHNYACRIYTSDGADE